MLESLAKLSNILNSTFKNPREKNEKTSKFKNFCWFHRFAMYCESTESVEGQKYFIILANKRLVGHFSELELILLSVKSAKNEPE